MKIFNLILVLCVLLVLGNAYAQISKNYPEIYLFSNGYVDSGNIDDIWDLTQGDLIIETKIILNELVDDYGGSAHAWSEIGIREICESNFNPGGYGVGGKGIWVSTDYDWNVNTFDPNADDNNNGIINDNEQDLDDKLILQKVGGHDESDYNLPAIPPNQWANHRLWFDRDGVDQWQAQNPLMVDGGTYNTEGIYKVRVVLHATTATIGTAYMYINDLSQGFETDGNWNTMELTPAGMTFIGNMKQMQVFYGLYGYGANHSMKFKNIHVTGFLNEQQEPVADFVADETDGIGELCVQFTNLSQNACSYLWDFGDGETSTEKNPEHCYYNPPTKHYTVTLTAYGPGGEDTIVKENYITVNKEANASFDCYPIVGAPALEVQFTNECGGNVNNFLWDYGDGENEEFQHDYNNQIHPLHIYQEIGEYTVSLKAWGNGGEDIFTAPNLIYVDSCFTSLTFMEGSAPIEERYGWNNVIDYDVMTGDNSRVLTANGDAWAIFAFEDMGVKTIHKLRIIANTVLGTSFHNHLAENFEIWISTIGTDEADFSLGFSGSLTSNHDWEVFELDAPILAKYIKLVLVNARSEESPYVTLCEFQVFGKSTAIIPVARTTESDGLISSSETPVDYGLSQNYPNPFNPETIISYQLPEAADVQLDIYNINGQLITTLVNSYVKEGYHHVVWDGRDESAKTVAGGMYIFTIRATNINAETFRFSKKMTFMK